MTAPDHNLWSQVKINLKNKNSENRLLHTWFEPTELVNTHPTHTGGTCFQLGVPTELHKYWISENIFDRIRSEEHTSELQSH